MYPTSDLFNILTTDHTVSTYFSFQNDDGEEKAAVTLDYNAIFGNMYRDFLAANSVSTTNGSGSSSFPMTTTTVSATASATDNGKVSIPPECYAVSFAVFRRHLDGDL